MAPTEIKKSSNLAKKILAVVAGIGVLKKDKKNDFHNYQYASDELIVAAVREAVIKNGLTIFPSQTECTEIMTKTAKGQDQIITKLRMEFELVDVDSGESKVVSFYGYGSDTGDKGIYKASTGCEKYFLMKTFLLAMPDDPEFEKNQAAARRAYSERSSERSSAPVSTKPAAQPPVVSNPTPPNAEKPAAPAWPHPAEEKKYGSYPPPSARAERKIVNNVGLSEVKRLTKLASNGSAMFRLVGNEGESWLTFSETVAKDASEFAKKGVVLNIALDVTKQGSVAVGVTPA